MTSKMFLDINNNNNKKYKKNHSIYKEMSEI